MSALLLLSGAQSLSAEQKEVLLWLFRPPLQTAALSETSKLTEGPGSRLVEIGPRYQIQIEFVDPLCHSLRLNVRFKELGAQIMCSQLCAPSVW